MIEYKSRQRSFNHAPFDQINAVGPDQLLPQKVTKTTSFSNQLSIFDRLSALPKCQSRAPVAYGISLLTLTFDKI